MSKQDPVISSVLFFTLLIQT